MQKKEDNKRVGQKLIYKLLVYLVSFSIAAFVIGIVVFVQIKKQGEVSEQLRLEEENSKETAKVALTEDEIEELFKEHKQEELQKTEPETENDAEVNATEGVETELEEDANLVDWEGLWEVNDDVYAWITIPGTNIDYPILQHDTDNSYYLNYNIDGSYGFPGCIYTENLNAKDFTDNNTVIYGHNLKKGTMFSQLHNFREKDFFDQHDKVYIYTPDAIFEYTIFAAYPYDDRHLMHSFDFSDEEVYATYLESVLDMRELTSNIRSGVEVTKENKIITLSTCIRGEASKRLIVQAVLQK